MKFNLKTATVCDKNLTLVHLFFSFFLNNKEDRRNRLRAARHKDDGKSKF